MKLINNKLYMASENFNKFIKIMTVYIKVFRERDNNLIISLRGNVKKKNSIFKDIVHQGGREVNPISKNLTEMIFLTKVGEGGGHKTYCLK